MPLDDYHNWWEYVPGASWKHPGGRGTTTNGRDHHPVVQVACEDAEAYAAWAGKELPTEAEWELAARGGLDGAAFAWGDEHMPDGTPMANTWQGEFPWQNLKLDGYEGTSPVGSFPPNGYGLYDMTGNVWEWTADWYTPRHPDEVSSPCCVPHNPRVASTDAQPSRRAAGRAVPATGDQGRLAPLRAQLLPPLPPGGAAGADDRHLDGASRLPLRRPHANPREPRRDLMPDKPNILVIWGDDIGITNLSCYSDGLMGYRTPNIDRIADEGMRFTDSYGEQSCTAGRSSFITGQSVYRTGLSKVGDARHGHRPPGRGPDDRRAAEAARLRDGAVRQEPPRRPEQVPADGARLRRVLRQPLPPERRGGAGAAELAAA